MFELSEDQKKILVQLEKWFADKQKDPYITMGGFAGTGKTSLIAYYRKTLNDKNPKLSVAFCSYTGKATRVLRNKIRDFEALFPNDTISTIHALMYSPRVNESKEIIGWDRKSKLEADLVVIDEASMVDSEVWQDLLRYKIPIIAVGDHGQLPPIKGDFNLMQNPQLRLEKIHRQAEDNPIIHLSILARENGEIPISKYSDSVMKLSRGSYDSQEIIGELLRNYKPDTLVLCGYNTTRIKTNRFIRDALEFDSLEPKARDRVICLRNNHEKNIFNGMLGSIISVDPDSDKKSFKAVISMDGEESNFSGSISAEQFNNAESLNFTKSRSRVEGVDLFDFGYALTVHKAQGSQAVRVVLFEERFSKMDADAWKRWLYTAVTRAESELYIVG
jgi:exodeoxyribonuclease V